MRRLFVILTIIIPAIADGQSFEAALENILKNNPQLKAAEQLMQVKQLEANTGRYLPDPSVQGAYLFGSPTDAGNQVELQVSQQFRFPGYYLALKDAAGKKEALAEAEFQVARQQVAMEAAQLLAEMIFLQQKLDLLNSVMVDVEKLENLWQRKFDKGEATILELQKAKKALAEHRLELMNVRTRQQMLKLELQRLNGGAPVTFNDTIYPEAALPVADSLVTFFDMAPYSQMWQLQMNVQDEQVKVARKNKLPEMEGGFRYETILDHTLKGPYLGINIPLWEKKNTVQLQQAQQQYIQSSIAAEQQLLQNQLRQSLAQQQILQEQVQSLEQILNDLGNLQLLQKALELGEITIIEYYNEAAQYYNLHFDYLEKLYELNKVKVQWWVWMR